MSWIDQVGGLLPSYSAASGSCLAEATAEHDSSILDRASELYAQHPALVKSMGARALAVVMSHLSQHH